MICNLLVGQAGLGLKQWASRLLRHGHLSWSCTCNMLDCVQTCAAICALALRAVRHALRSFILVCNCYRARRVYGTFPMSKSEHPRSGAFSLEHLDARQQALCFQSRLVIWPRLFQRIQENSVSVFCVGDVAKIKCRKYRKDLNGAMVRIVSRTEELNQERLLDTIVSVPTLAAGCWHVLRILHRCRWSGSCEALVEGWGSILEMLDVSRQHHSYE